MGNKLKLLLSIFALLLFGIVGVNNKVSAAGCYIAHSYGSYPGANCNTWTSESDFMHSCVENNSYSRCYSLYHTPYNCWGPWYDISCDASNCGQTITCSVCGNTVTCPACESATPTPTNSPSYTNTPVPTNTLTPTPTPPPCSNLNASFSQNSCSLDITISGASSYFRNLTFSGPPLSTITQNILYRHTITSAGTKAWTLNWQEVGYSTTNCSLNISTNIPAPDCGSVNTATAPIPPVWGNNINLKAVFSPSASLASTPHTYNLLSNSHSTMTSCSGDAFSSSGENCFLQWISSNPKTYPWDIQWQTASKSCPSVVSGICSWSSQLQAVNQASYLKTDIGVSYIKTVNNQPAFNLTDSFSSNIFGSSRLSSTDHTPVCTGSAFNCTKYNYLLLGYTDSNSITSPATWYSYLKGPLETNAKLNIINWIGAKNLGAVMTSGLLSDSKENVVEITGDFDATGVCSKATIFLISGNLNITPNLSISNTTSDACLFIVNLTTRILDGLKTPMTCSGTHIDYTNVANPKDNIQAFIITSNFTTNPSPIQLYIKGGVITNTSIDGYNRKVNTDSCLYPNLPSELIDYEGARYIKNLRIALESSTILSVFEQQYKSTK